MPIKDSDKKSQVSDGLKGLQKLIQVEDHILSAMELLTKVPVNIRTHLGDLVRNLTTAKEAISNFTEDKINALYAAPGVGQDVMEPVPEDTKVCVVLNYFQIDGWGVELLADIYYSKNGLSRLHETVQTFAG